MVEAKNNSFLETEKLGVLMRKYALPCIISLLVGALYNIVDQIFIANASYLGSYGNAANSVVFPLTVIALAIATMIGDGCCTLVSISLGAKDDGKADRGVGNSIVISIIIGLILTAVYLIFPNQILTAFGATVNEETFAMSKEYFFWISLGIPFYMFGQAMNSVIRSDGSPKFAMITLLVGAVTNIILDPVLIYGCRMGMAGAAIATILGQILSAVLSVIYLFRTKAVKLGKSSFKLDIRLIGKILSLGISSFLSQISIVFSMAAVLNMCRKYGAMDPIFSQSEYAQIPTAVIGIVMKFFQIIISVAIGLSAGCIPVVGYNIGSGRRDRAKELMKRLLITEAIIGAAALLLFELFPQPLINLFGAKNESIYYREFALRSIRLLLSMTMLSCVNKGAAIYMQALGKALTSSFLSMLREVVFGVGLPLLLPLFFGLDGILYFMPTADILTFIVTVVVIIKTGKELSAPIRQKGTQDIY